jgi:hypothetical protein
MKSEDRARIDKALELAKVPVEQRQLTHHFLDEMEKLAYHRKQMTTQQKVDFIKLHGNEKFMQLPD